MVIEIDTAKRYIKWIPVAERLPDDRRAVLVWGMAGILFENPLLGKECFLGISKYNISRNGGAFDCTRLHVYSFFWRRVTHWAEITGPKERARMVA